MAAVPPPSPGFAYGAQLASPDAGGRRSSLEALGLTPAAPASTPASTDGLWGYVVSFFDDLARSIADTNLRDAGYDPDVERFHRALIADNPANRLPGAPTGDADRDCVIHDQWTPEANQAHADRVASLNTSINTAMGFAGGRGGGGAAGRTAMLRLLARAERRPILDPKGVCLTCNETSRVSLGQMTIPGPRLVRTLARGEKVDALIDELVRRTRATGNEHGIFALTTGERVIIEGGPEEIQLVRGTRRVLVHTHPKGTPVASPGDLNVLENGGLGLAEKGQQHSYIIVIERDGSRVIRFDKPKPVAPVDWDAFIDAQLKGL